LNGKNGFNTANYGKLRFKTLTGEDEQLWGNTALETQYPSIVDNWDHRRESEIQYEESVTYPDTGDEYMLVMDTKLMKIAIREYQQRLIRVMEEYFDQVEI
jgi:hypothetical protein